MPRWDPFARRRPPEPKPGPESHVPHLYWLAAVCFILLLLRLWAWRVSWGRVRKEARLQADLATKAIRSAARHRQADESQLSTDVGQRLEGCLRLNREVRVRSACKRLPRGRARNVIRADVPSRRVDRPSRPFLPAGRPSTSRRASTWSGCARTYPRPTTRFASPTMSSRRHVGYGS